MCPIKDPFRDTLSVENVMAYFPDLSNECQIAFGEDVKAVGWLDKNHSFTKGTVNESFLQMLKRHIADRWTFIVAAGLHECELCSKFASACNVIIPTEKFVYIAPEMISHYIEAHNYKPPDEFIQAVIDCPEQEYEADLEIHVSLGSTICPIKDPF